ncbi:hypothetical protein [Acidiluteibacter ferrifornacis]|uniref:Uncharacterized protein n=1 Tax=Acidiluteibacter ferrifornacis TaxID=2692424 RepID=A0A6N9NL34_9FLAO|nr:hypothetical protein [Acidiluteibacter ferrifornacis]NBG67416.1 hypothetical protein [Acidiluteibacter ferrifornacis]
MGLIIVNQDLSIYNDNEKMFRLIEWDKDGELCSMSEEMKLLIDKFSKKGIEIGISLKYERDEILDLILTPKLEESAIIDNCLHFSEHSESINELIDDFFNKSSLQIQSLLSDKDNLLLNEKDSLRITVKKSNDSTN